MWVGRKAARMGLNWVASMAVDSADSLAGTMAAWKADLMAELKVV